MKCISCSPCLASKLVLLGALVVGYFGGCSFLGAKSSCPISTSTSSGGSTSESFKRGTAIGDLAPSFSLATVDGNSISSSELAGRPAVIVFWTAWCPICKEEAPQINKLAAEFEQKGVKVVGINIGESDARIAEGIKDFGIQYPVAKDRDRSVAKAFNVIGTPTIIILDKIGAVEYSGHEVPEDYVDRLNKLIDG